MLHVQIRPESPQRTSSLQYRLTICNACQAEAGFNTGQPDMHGSLADYTSFDLHKKPTQGCSYFPARPVHAASATTSTRESDNEHREHTSIRLSATEDGCNVIAHIPWRFAFTLSAYARRQPFREHLKGRAPANM